MISSMSYAAAMEQLEAIANAESDPTINPICRGFAHTHGQRTARCIVLLHGYTNCPQQFRRFAAQLHQLGHNVYVPRIPRHGLADRMTDALSYLNRSELLNALDQTITLATGLGERVDLLGLSTGANLVIHAAQHRSDIYQAVIIAPVLGTPTIPFWATTMLARLAMVAPNQFRWWDPQIRDQGLRVRHAYPRIATRSLGMLVGMGLRTLAQARSNPPRARDILVVYNAADEAVTRAPIEELVARWRNHGAPVRTHCFAAELGLIHDLIDPDQEQQRVDYVYPVLLDLIC